MYMTKRCVCSRNLSNCRRWLNKRIKERHEERKKNALTTPREKANILGPKRRNRSCSAATQVENKRQSHLEAELKYCISKSHLVDTMMITAQWSVPSFPKESNKVDPSGVLFIVKKGVVEESADSQQSHRQQHVSPVLSSQQRQFLIWATKSTFRMHVKARNFFSHPCSDCC